jgi:hypothetical protein
MYICVYVCRAHNVFTCMYMYKGPRRINVTIASAKHLPKVRMHVCMYVCRAHNVFTCMHICIYTLIHGALCHKRHHPHLSKAHGNSHVVVRARTCVYIHLYMEHCATKDTTHIYQKHLLTATSLCMYAGHTMLVRARTCVCVYIYIYIYIYMCVYIYTHAAPQRHIKNTC